MADTSSGDAGGGGRKSDGNANSAFGDAVSDLFPGGFAVVDPGEAADGGSGKRDSGTGTGRKRGRPRGSGSKAKTAQSVHLDVSGVEKVLLSIHVGLAAITHIPELAIDEKEAASVADAFVRVARHYPILDKIGDKAVDHVNLLMVMVGVYGSRVAAYKLLKASEAEPQKPKAPVVQMVNPVQQFAPDAGAVN